MLRVPAAMPLPSTAGARGAPDLGGAPGTWRLKSVARFVWHAKCPTASLTSLERSARSRVWLDRLMEYVACR